jgi:hypothetical protein
MKLYLAGPMRGIPYFNFPAFNDAADKLRAEGHVVFNPVEKDTEKYGEALASNNADGCEAKASIEHGFDLRDALAMDTAWICKHAEGIALLKGWHNSSGARAEFALASALKLKVIYLDDDDPSKNEPFTTQALAKTASVGLRHDSGKLRVDLIPPEWITELAEVFTAGAKKYADRNWELGMPWSKVWGPLLRHAFKWLRGEERDPETGCLHLAMAAWNALALMTYQERNLGTKDLPAWRPMPGPEVQSPQSSPR